MRLARPKREKKSHSDNINKILIATALINLIASIIALIKSLL